MADAKWTYDASTGRYRGPDGRFVSEAALLKLRDGLIAGFAERAKEATDALLAGGKLSAWEGRMRAELKKLAADAYMLGRGGLNLTGDADRDRIADFVGQQEAYLHNFAKEIDAGTLTMGQVGARSAMYPRAARSQFDAARGQARGIDLPGFPCVGTRCGANCRCSWRITDYKTKIVARWELGGSEHCADCQSRALKWGAVEFPKGEPEAPEEAA